MGKLWERHRLLKLPQKEIEILNKPIKSKETTLIILKLPTKKNAVGFTAEFYLRFKGN